jgi:hypothetical protein
MTTQQPGRQAILSGSTFVADPRMKIEIEVCARRGSEV